LFAAPNKNKLSDDATVVDNTERRLDVEENDGQISDASNSGSGDSSSFEEGDNDDEMKGAPNVFVVRYNEKDQQLTPRSKLQADTRPTAMTLPIVKHDDDLVLRLTCFSFIDSICMINAIFCRVFPKCFVGEKNASVGEQ